MSEEKRRETVPKGAACWICKRTNKDIEKEIDAADYDKVMSTEVTNRHLAICGNCEDIISGIFIKTVDELQTEDRICAFLNKLIQQGGK